MQKNIAFHVAVVFGFICLATPSHGETVSTRFGDLEVINGYPTKNTATQLYDEMDFQRATQAYLWAFPAVSNASIQIALSRDLGAAHVALA